MYKRKTPEQLEEIRDIERLLGLTKQGATQFCQRHWQRGNDPREVAYHHIQVEQIRRRGREQREQRKSWAIEPWALTEQGWEKTGSRSRGR